MTLERRISFFVYILLNKSFIQVSYRDHVSSSVDHWSKGAVFSPDHKRRNPIFLSGPVVVGTKGWCNMNDTCTFFSCDKIAGYYPESSFARIHPVDQLFIVNAFELRSGEFTRNFERDLFVARFIF